MIDGDDKLSKRYRDLGSEEPPRALNEAILASARRAVAPRTTQRWAMPVSIAAVLVLAAGVTLRMQQEQPGIETAAPASEYSLPPSSPEPSAAPEKVPEKKLQVAEPFAPPATKSTEVESRRDEQPKTAKPAAKLEASAPMQNAQPLESDSRKEKKAFADAAAPPPTAMRARPPVAGDALRAQRAAPQAAPEAAPTRQAAPAAVAREPFAERGSAPNPAPATPPATALAPSPTAGAPAPQLRAKRDASGAVADLASERSADRLERELERIAKLRREGRHSEADVAIEKFRRENPSYRIPETMWEQVKPR